MASVRTPFAPLANSSQPPSTPPSTQQPFPATPSSTACGTCAKCRGSLPPTPVTRTPSRRARTRTTSGLQDSSEVPNETPDLATLIQQIRDVLAPYDLLSAPDDAMSDDDAMASSLYIVGQGFSSLPGSVPVKLQKLMRQYKSSEPDFRPYAYFPSLESGQGTPACAKYTRNLVDRGNGEYNLLVLCWPEGSSSQIHDHPGAHCIVKMLSGRLQEKRYKRETKGEALKLVTERVLETDQVCYMHDKFGLHSMHNDHPTASSGPAISLHLYSPPIPLCHVFDLTNGEAQVVDCTRVESTGGVRGRLSMEDDGEMD